MYFYTVLGGAQHLPLGIVLGFTQVTFAVHKETHLTGVIVVLVSTAVIAGHGSWAQVCQGDTLLNANHIAVIVFLQQALQLAAAESVGVVRALYLLAFSIVVEFGDGAGGADHGYHLAFVVVEAVADSANRVLGGADTPEGVVEVTGFTEGGIAIGGVVADFADQAAVGGVTAGDLQAVGIGADHLGLRVVVQGGAGVPFGIGAAEQAAEAVVDITGFIGA
ncbi:hypothetical protein GL2_37970 [Microbulbifer sp. GL-2]|nr:hypothetical protein GL2_37970 [Microbulbifer sp. GL-2]